MSAIRLLPVANTRALLAIDGPASATWNTIVESVTEGAVGNQSSLAAVADGTWEACVGTLTLVAQPGDTETVTIDAAVYTFQTVLTNVAGNVLIGASASATLDNLIAAINLAAGAGTTYAAATTEHPTVRAYAGAGDTMVVHSRPAVTAAVGTLIATTDGMANAGNVWGAATLADGVDGTNVTFVVTGAAVVCHYADGFSTVEDFEAALAADAPAAAVLRVKTAGTTPLYLLVVTDDDFSATNLTGGGVGTQAAPTLTNAALGVAIPHTSEMGLALVRNVDTATGTTKTATTTIWGFSVVTNRWYKLKALNGGSAIAETTSDAINYSETFTSLRGFTRLYCEQAVGGAGTEIEVYVDCIPAEAVSR